MGRTALVQQQGSNQQSSTNSSKGQQRQKGREVCSTSMNRKSNATTGGSIFSPSKRKSSTTKQKNLSPSGGTTRRNKQSTATRSSTTGTGNRRSRATSASSSSSSSPLPLEEPTIIYQNNHVLVVNKPAGWHSVPNDTRDFQSNNKKCLLTHLKQRQLGGGSNQDFLLPMHRLDQPCTGALIFAKNKKAGTRITTAWKKLQVIKEYWCIVEGDLTKMKSISRSNHHRQHNKDNKDRHSHNDSTKPEHKQKNQFKYSVDGVLKRVSSSNSRSVVVSPVPADFYYVNDDDHHQHQEPKIKLKEGERLCHLDWDLIQRNVNNNSNLQLIKVQTSTGARHQVRAMLAQLLRSPIAGDLRYSSSNEASPLDDQSVALHARSIYLPTVQLGGMEFLSTTPFVAPIPNLWKTMFRLEDKHFR